MIKNAYLTVRIFAKYTQLMSKPTDNKYYLYFCLWYEYSSLFLNLPFLSGYFNLH